MSDIVERLQNIIGGGWIESNEVECALGEINRLRDYINANMKDDEIARRTAQLGVNLYEANAEIERLRERLAVAERDAARYQWLKENCVKYYDPPSFLLEWAWDSNDVDAAIDAVRATDNVSGDGNG